MKPKYYHFTPFVATVHYIEPIDIILEVLFCESQILWLLLICDIVLFCDNFVIGGPAFFILCISVHGTCIFIITTILFKLCGCWTCKVSAKCNNACTHVCTCTWKTNSCMYRHVYIFEMNCFVHVHQV